MENTSHRGDGIRQSNEESNRITRECLRIAMFQLMGKKDFEKITITEIAQVAGVSRTAFYRNYSSKEELVSDVTRSVFAELKNTLQSEVFLNDREQWYVNFFRTIRGNSGYFRIWLDAHLYPDDKPVLESVFPSASVEEYYSRAAHEGAFLSVLTNWFERGMQESPEEMGAICMKIIHSGQDAE